MSPEAIIDWWTFLTELNYVSGPNNNPIESPPESAEWFEPYYVPFATYDTNELHLDIRNGNVIEVVDGPCYVMADSLEQLLTELAKQKELGRKVMMFGEGKCLGPFLNSKLWQIYE